MYKISFALASVLALADALHLKTSCNPCCNPCCDEDDEADDETVDPACANLAAELMSITGWDQLEVLTFDKMN